MEKLIGFLFDLMTVAGNKASLFHEVAGVPSRKKKKKPVEIPGQFQKSYQLIQMASFPFLLVLGVRP